MSETTENFLSSESQRAYTMGYMAGFGAALTHLFSGYQRLLPAAAESSAPPAPPVPQEAPEPEPVPVEAEAVPVEDIMDPNLASILGMPSAILNARG